MDVLSVKSPESEKLAFVRCWVQWTDIQQKKGLLSWMIKDHEVAKRNREEALKRKDSKLKHVIISKHVDKKLKLYLIRYMHMLFVWMRAHSVSR
jgi:U3 small nucleolar RNA-associated protein 14